LRKLGVLAEGQSPTTNQNTTALEALNLMIKAWSSEGIVAHQIRTLYIYPEAQTVVDPSQTNNTVFELGPASSDHESSLELGLTKLSAAEAASQTDLSVSTTAAVDVFGTTANSDIVGIELDNGDIQWTTISSGGGTATITVAAAIVTAAASGGRVYFFTARAQRPEKILDCWLVTASTGARKELTLTPENTMMGLDQTVQSEPTMWNYRLMLDDGLFRVWPGWSDGNTYIEARAMYPFDDMDATGDTFSFPNTCYEALVYSLAVRLAPEYKLPLQERMLLKQEADAMKMKAFDHLIEGTSIFVQPESLYG
jgi:hypothetical protein